MKLACIHAAGNWRKISVQDLAWAKATFEVSLHNSRDFIEETAVDTEWEKDYNQVFNLFKKKACVTEKYICGRVPRLQMQKIRMIVSQLIVAGKIAPSVGKKMGPKTPGWSLLQDQNS